METQYTIILYHSQDDLRVFNSKIKFGSEKWSVGRIYSGDRTDDLKKMVTKKVDALYERVQEILDMRRKISKTNIRLYGSQKQLRDAYSNKYGKKCSFRAWYIFSENTIYLNLNDLHEGMLAHELAHSIIDHYLLIRPPVQSAEILARYVDSHLKR